MSALLELNEHTNIFQSFPLLCLCMVTLNAVSEVAMNRPLLHSSALSSTLSLEEEAKFEIELFSCTYIYVFTHTCMCVTCLCIHTCTTIRTRTATYVTGHTVLLDVTV